MDLVLCNPHTLKNDQLAKNPNPHLAIAVMKFTSLQEVVTVSADLLKQMVASQWFIVLIVSWIFYMPWKTPILRRKSSVCLSEARQKANVLLIEGIKQGKRRFSCVTTSFYIQ